MGAASDTTIGDGTPRGPAALDFEDLLNQGVTDEFFACERIEQAEHRVPHLVDQLVDDRVEFDLNIFALGGDHGLALDLGIEADDDGIRGTCEEDIIVGNRARGGMKDFECDLLRFDLPQGPDNGLDRPGDVSLEQNAKVFCPLLHAGEKVFHPAAARRREFLEAFRFEALFGEPLGVALGFHFEHFIADVWRAGEADDFARDGRCGFSDRVAAIVRAGS